MDGLPGPGAPGGVASATPIAGGTPAPAADPNLHDPNAPPKVMQRMAERIPGSRYREFSGIGHLMNLEAPDDFDQALIEFLREPLPHRVH